ncbi:MAG TPA: hypothetical protein VH661_06045 [Candidatus Dormibacteraeota bacterium]|nr:hypothetical protein [Candidatus Dormibacteraeota bacterium]
MPTSDPAKAQKRLRKVEHAHTRLAELAKRINAQAAVIADLIAQANRLAEARKAAPAVRKATGARTTATATRKKATATRKPATAGRRPRS